MITLNTTSSWVQTCYPRLGSSQTAQKETWNGLISPSHFIQLEVYNSNEFNAMEHMFHIQVKDKIFGEDWLKSFATEVLDASIKKNVAEVMKGLTHLDAPQKQTCFKCYRKTKGCLMKLLMFIHMKRLSKEDNRVCWISNSHQLNKVKRQKQYPLLIITDILRKSSRYNFFTKPDVSMQYYTFELDNKS